MIANRGRKVLQYINAVCVFTKEEVEYRDRLHFWLTLCCKGEALQQERAAFVGVRHSLLVNSGSSANLIAVSALTSSKLPENQRIK